MDSISTRFAAIFVIIASQILVSHAETCSDHTFSESRVFESCKDLPVLKANLHWTYSMSTKRAHIAYRAEQDPTGWIAWAINPTGSGMVGSQAIVAFRNPNGSVAAYPTAINDYNPKMEPSALSIGVSNVSAEYVKGEMTIFAVVGPLTNGAKVNHVWQAGNSVSGGVPQAHQTSGPNVQSMEKVDFSSG